MISDLVKEKYGHGMGHKEKLGSLILLLVSRFLSSKLIFRTQCVVLDRCPPCHSVLAPSVILSFHATRIGRGGGIPSITAGRVS